MKASGAVHWRNEVTGLKARLRAKLRSTPELRTATITFLFAALSATGAYIANTLESIRDTKLKFVNEQIEKLYGPMYALTQANNAAWNEFCGAIVPTCEKYGFFSERHMPTEAEVRLWRLWMKTVFQPFNVKMESVITTNAQLAIGSEFPKTFWLLVAHTEGYKPIMSEWKDSSKKNANFRKASFNVVNGLNYPTEIIACVKDSYRALAETRDALEATVFYGLFASTHAPKSCS
jgi:hypothetical protein